MKCPNCSETLVMSSREGIEIDYCPKCRGVWLDRGELDKIIEKSAPTATPAFDQSSRENIKDDDYKYKKHGKYKHKSFLGDLFDF